MRAKDWRGQSHEVDERGLRVAVCERQTAVASDAGQEGGSIQAVREGGCASMVGSILGAAKSERGDGGAVTCPSDDHLRIV